MYLFYISMFNFLPNEDKRAVAYLFKERNGEPGTSVEWSVLMKHIQKKVE